MRIRPIGIVNHFFLCLSFSLEHPIDSQQKKIKYQCRAFLPGHEESSPAPRPGFSKGAGVVRGFSFPGWVPGLKSDAGERYNAPDFTRRQARDIAQAGQAARKNGIVFAYPRPGTALARANGKKPEYMITSGMEDCKAIL